MGRTSLRHILHRILAPRMVVERGAIPDDDLARLANAGPGDVIQVRNMDRIRLLDPRPIRVVLGERKRPPTPAMGPTMRRRP